MGGICSSCAGGEEPLQPVGLPDGGSRPAGGRTAANGTSAATGGGPAKHGNPGAANATRAAQAGNATGGVAGAGGALALALRSPRRESSSVHGQRPPSERMHLRQNLVHQHRDSDPSSYYDVVKQLGTGLSGAVWQVRSKATGTLLAMKSLEKSRVASEQLSDLANEVDLLRRCDHPNIVKLVEWFDRDQKLVLIMEALSGGELYDRLQAQPGGRYPEREAAVLMRQMVSAVAYLHHQGIVHRDLKLENFLFVDRQGSELKLIDLGLSHRYLSPTVQGGDADVQRMHSIVGTPYYIAPEILNQAEDPLGGYGEQVDAWSLGVIGYMLLAGVPPFKGRRDHEVLAAVKRGKFSLSGPRWEGISEDAKSFLRRLLVYNPAKRMTVEQALQHPWLAATKYAIEAQPLHPDVLNGLRRYAALRGWKRAALEAAAFSLPDEHVVAPLRSAFEKLDKSGNGYVGLPDFTAALLKVGITREEAAQLFAAAVHGSDEEGIAYTAWLAACFPKRLLSRDRLKEAFDALDVDGRGYLTRESLVRVLGDDAQGLASGDDDFEGLFSGGSGVADFERFFAAFQPGPGGLADGLASPLVAPSGAPPPAGLLPSLELAALPGPAVSGGPLAADLSLQPLPPSEASIGHSMLSGKPPPPSGNGPAVPAQFASADGAPAYDRLPLVAGSLPASAQVPVR